MDIPTYPAQVLLVGRSRKVLRKLSTALAEDGIRSTCDQTAAEALRHLAARPFDLIAFGREVSARDKKRIRESALQRDPGVIFVNGLAPVTGLLVAQVKTAFWKKEIPDLGFHLLPFENTPYGLKMHFEVIAKQHGLQVDLYHINFFYRVTRETLPLGEVGRGQHFVMLVSSLFGRKRPQFIVVRNGRVPLEVQPVVWRTSGSR
jgi:hypothetical protein